MITIEDEDEEGKENMIKNGCLGYGGTSTWSKREHPSGWLTDQEARGDKTVMYRATWNLQPSFFGNGGGDQ